MVRSDFMEKIGFFDENFFLYCKEGHWLRKLKFIRNEKWNIH